MRVELFRALQGGSKNFNSYVVKMLREMEELTVSPEEVRYLAGILDQGRLRLVLNAIKIEDIRRKVSAANDPISYLEVDEHQEFLNSPIVCSAIHDDSAVGLSVVSIDTGAQKATIDLSFISFRTYTVHVHEYFDLQVVVDLKHIDDVDEFDYVYGCNKEVTSLSDVDRQLAVLRNVDNLNVIFREFYSLELPRSRDQLRPYNYVKD